MYNSRFKKIKEGKVSDTYESLTNVIFNSLNFSIKAVEQAQSISDNVRKALKKSPIPIHQRISDISKSEMLDQSVWIDKIFNSIMFDLLEIDVLRDLASSALDDDRLKREVAFELYKKSPKNEMAIIKTLEKFI